MNDGQLLDRVLSDFTGAISGSWGPNLSAYLLPLLLSLVCLQFGLIAIEAAIGRDMPLVLMHIVLGIIRIGIVVAIFQHAAEWGTDIAQTFQQIGQDISGMTPATGPSEVFNNGGQLAQIIFHAKASGSWLNELVQSAEFVIVGFAVLATWALASLLYLGVLIEVTLLVYAGPLVICVTPLSWTFELLITWARSVLSIGFKIALILMTLAIGIVLAAQWEATIAANVNTLTTNLWQLLLPAIESALFAYCVWKIPNRLSALAPGAAIIGFGEAVAGMAGSAAGSTIKGSGASGSTPQSGGTDGGGTAGAAWANHVSHALHDGAKALAQKVQSKLTS